MNEPPRPDPAPDHRGEPSPTRGAGPTAGAEADSRVDAGAGTRTPPAAGSWIGLGALVTLTLLLWGVVALPQDAGPAYDDREAVVGNPVVEGALPARAAFARDYWHHLEDAGHYRPLATLLLRVDRAASGGPPAAPDWVRFRRTNVALHGLVVALLGAALIRFGARRGLPVPWVGLAVLALHPACADVVAWISGRTSLVSALGASSGLLGVTFLRRGSRRLALASGAVAFAACTIALLGKEDGVVLVAVLPAAAWACAGARAAAGAAAGGALSLAAVSALRLMALGSALPASPSAPLAGLPLTERVTLGLAAWEQGLARLLTAWSPWPPSTHLADLEASPGPGFRAGLLLAALGLGAVAIAVRGRRSGGAADGGDRRLARAGLWGLAAACVASAPLLQLVPAGELFAPRFLYQPLLLGVFGVAALVELPLGLLRSARARALARAGLVLACAALVPRAADAYRDRQSYWEAHLPAHAEDPRVWNDLGNAARERGDGAAAREAFERAVELDPTYSRPRTNLGTLALEAGDLIEAELHLVAAVQAGPRNPVARANLGNLLLRAGEHEAAAAEYRMAVGLAPGRSAYHRGLGRALAGAGDVEGARAALAEALRLDPADGRALDALERLGPDGSDGRGPGGGGGGGR